ncbi:MAG: uroporphyrinogen decarboxylase family protein [Desulfobacterales bacterium]
MNKRDTVLGLLDKSKEQEYIPAGFFLHFEKAYHKGQPAIDKHMEYFRYTGMDFVKIQYEAVFPPNPDIKKPKDWLNMPFFKKDFYQSQLNIAEGLVKAAKNEALVIMTLYSSFMMTQYTTQNLQLLTDHMKADPESFKKGMEIITDSLMIFVKECIRLGVDGFYTSTQGYESFRALGLDLFSECIKPFDLALMEEADRSCIFNILHICDYIGEYGDLAPFGDYPGHVINFGYRLGSKEVTGREISRIFGRPFMGGLDRNGVMATGGEADIKKSVEKVLADKPEKFILGADCTLPEEIDRKTLWRNAKTAIAAAHGYK